MATGLGGDMAEVQSAIWKILYVWGPTALWVAPSGPRGAVLWGLGLGCGWGQTRLLAAVEKSGTQPAAKTIVIDDKEFLFPGKKRCLKGGHFLFRRFITGSSGFLLEGRWLESQTAAKSRIYLQCTNKQKCLLELRKKAKKSTLKSHPPWSDCGVSHPLWL